MRSRWRRVAVHARGRLVNGTAPLGALCAAHQCVQRSARRRAATHHRHATTTIPVCGKARRKSLLHMWEGWAQSRVPMWAGVDRGGPIPRCGRATGRAQSRSRCRCRSSEALRSATVKGGYGAAHGSGVPRSRLSLTHAADWRAQVVPPPRTCLTASVYAVAWPFRCAMTVVLSLHAKSQRRCGGGEPSPGEDVAAGARSRRRRGEGEPSAAADVAASRGKPRRGTGVGEASRVAAAEGRVLAQMWRSTRGRS